MKKIIWMVVAAILTTGLISFEKNLEAQSGGSKNQPSKVPQDPAANIQNAARQGSQNVNRVPNARDLTRPVENARVACQENFVWDQSRRRDFRCGSDQYKCEFDSFALQEIFSDFGTLCEEVRRDLRLRGEFRVTLNGAYCMADFSNASDREEFHRRVTPECPSGFFYDYFPPWETYSSGYAACKRSAEIVSGHCASDRSAEIQRFGEDDTYYCCPR